MPSRNDKSAVNDPLRICIIGNSHVAALKLAWDRLAPSRPDVQITFFAARFEQLAHLAVEGSSLVPTDDQLAASLRYTSGGLDRIDAAAYDRFLLYGLLFFMVTLDRKYSAAVINQALRRAFAGTLSCKVATQLRSITEAPIDVSHNPLLPLGFRDNPQVSALPYADSIDHLNGGWAAERLRFVAQPANTIVEGWFTEPHFAKEAPLLATTASHEGSVHAERGAHMNSEFGEVYLKSYFKGIGAD